MPLSCLLPRARAMTNPPPAAPLPPLGPTPAPALLGANPLPPITPPPSHAAADNLVNANFQLTADTNVSADILQKYTLGGGSSSGYPTDPLAGVTWVHAGSHSAACTWQSVL
ncbi:hypothetical protein ACOMHN_022424 [Nucella lapillus]